MMRKMMLPITAVAASLALVVSSGCGRGVDLDVSRTFQEAQETFDDAEAPEDFLRAAGLYQSILERGVVSGVVLYNQGNAYMRAGQRGRAIAAYRQAQRYRPRDPYLEARREGVFANVTDLGALRDESVRPALWLLGLVGMGVLYGAVAVVTVQVRRFTTDTALARRRGAVARARGCVAQARAEMEGGRARAGADGIEDALVGLVADVVDIAEAGLTPKDVCAQLDSLGVAEDLVGRVANLLETCDAARYGSAGRTEGLSSRAEQVLDEVIRSLKAKKRFR